MQPQIFISYGFGQYDGQFRNCVSIIEGETPHDARETVWKALHGAWAFDYPIAELEEHKRKYNLQEIPLSVVAAEYPKYYPGRDDDTTNG